MFTEAVFSAFLTMAMPKVQPNMQTQGIHARVGYLSRNRFGTVSFSRHETRIGNLHAVLSWNKSDVLGVFLKPNGGLKCMVSGVYDEVSECFVFSGDEVGGLGCLFEQQVFCLDPL